MADSKIYRGFDIRAIEGGKIAVSRKDEPHVEICDTEDAALTYVDAIKRAERKGAPQ